MLHIQPTNLLLALLNRNHAKKPISSQKTLKNFLEKKVRRMGQQAEKKRKDQTERVTGLGRKNKRRNSKVESNDSPEIPDRAKL